jgi:alpha 1,3-glucosidase
VNDPLSLELFLDNSGSAEGTVYLDDGQTFDYKTGKHIYGKLVFSRKTLNYEIISGKWDESKAWLERVTIFGYPSKPQKIVLTSGEKSTQLAYKYDNDRKILVIRKPGLPFTNSWQIKVT